MKDYNDSRRKFLRKFLYKGSLVLGTGYVIAMNSVDSVAQEPKTPAAQAQKNPCDNMEGVSAEEVVKRKKLAYVNKTPIPDSHCSNCALYLPPGKDKPCGGCMLFKGPVRTEGYCAYWAPINN